MEPGFDNCPASVGRGLDPADQVTKPTRLVEWNQMSFSGHFPVVISEMIPFNVPTKNRNRVGGVKPPPYETSLQMTI